MRYANFRTRFCRDERATSAVEFAIVAPVFLMLVLGIVAYGTFLGMAHSIQQITAEAARASIAGVNDDERAALARSSVANNIGSYPLIQANHVTISHAATDAATSTFTLTLNYDASDSFIYALPRFVPLPPAAIVRSAAIQRGGY